MENDWDWGEAGYRECEPGASPQRETMLIWSGGWKM